MIIVRRFFVFWPTQKQNCVLLNKKNLKAFIFAAGLGTRLAPYTNTQPKALVQVANKAMLEHLILRLKSFGIHEIIINIHHFGEQIINFLEEKKYFDCDIVISDERAQLLDTGGGLKRALRLINKDEDLLVHNVDIWTNYDLNILIKTHKRNQTLATLLVQNRETSRYLLFEPKQLQLQAWINKKTGEQRPPQMDISQLHAFAFSGIHIVNSQALHFFPQDEVFPIIPVYLKIAEKQKISGLELSNTYWLDLGTPPQLKEAEKLIKTKDHGEIY